MRTNHPGLHSSVTDEQLESSSQIAMQSMVKGLADDSLSMSWRSSLNEHLLAVEAKKAKRKWITLVWRPMGFAMAAALVGLILLNPSQMAKNSAQVSSPTLASHLVAEHTDSAAYADLTDSALVSGEVVANRSQAKPAPEEWTELDVESL